MKRHTLLNSASRIWLLAVAIGAIGAPPAAAEPYLAQFKGMHCSACHSHPAGGGLRTTYGNAFAQAELPGTRLGDDSAPLWTGSVTDWLAIGGDLRADVDLVDVPGRESVAEFDLSRGTLYLEAQIIPNRLSLYIDQQLAPGSSVNREAYVRLNSADRRWYFMAGQFFLPFGLRLQDDSAFVRETTGINFAIPDRGIQLGFESGSWSGQVSVSNGTGGASEVDSGKQASAIASFVRPNWRAGLSLHNNDSDVGERNMQGVFLGVTTGRIVWLAEIDRIADDLPGQGNRDGIAGLLEANWLFGRGHNLKISHDYFDPDEDISENQQVRYSIVWEYTPFQFLQARIGARFYDGIPQVATQNRDIYFAELHGFF